jgi:hypothetical protein
MKENKNKIFHFFEKMNERLSSSLSYARITTARLQALIVHASIVLANSSRYFPPLGWLLDSITLIMLVNHPNNKISARTKAATTLVASITLGLGAFSLYALISGTFLFVLPYTAIFIAAVMALSYLALSFTHHLNSESKNFLGLEKDIKGLLENDPDLKPFKEILFSYYISQLSSLEGHNLPLDMVKAKSDKALDALDKNKLTAFFDKNKDIIERYRRASGLFNKSQNKLLISVTYFCSMALAIMATITTISNPALIGFMITVLTVGLLIKKSRIWQLIRHTIYEWNLKIDPRTKKIYDRMNTDMWYNIAIVAAMTTLIIIASFNVLSPLIAMVAIAFIVIMSGLSQLTKKLKSHEPHQGPLTNPEKGTSSGTPEPGLELAGRVEKKQNRLQKEKEQSKDPTAKPSDKNPQIGRGKAARR